MNHFADADIEDIMRDPKKYGAPTFEEFSRNPWRYRKQMTNVFDIADRGSQILGMVQDHKYEFIGSKKTYKCDSLEEVERVAIQEGCGVDDLEMKPEIIPLGGGLADILIRFRKKQRIVLNETGND